MTNRWGIPKEVEQHVKGRDLNCVYCGISFIDTVSTHKTRPTWEHIINDIRINSIDNIALCCGSCNASKGNKVLEEWIKGRYCKDKGITIQNVADVVKEYFNKNRK